jgi:hypothetical protein
MEYFENVQNEMHFIRDPSPVRIMQKETFMNRASKSCKMERFSTGLANRAKWNVFEQGLQIEQNGILSIRAK